ncbi:MAG: ATP synthase F1 subunit epsilon, partial [Bacteroidota bacterium]
NLSVLTADRSLFEGAIRSVKVPGVLGQFQVLNNHAPIVSALTAGAVTIVTEQGESVQFDIEQGFLEVLNNEASLLVQGVANA